jgi:type II secretory pathway component PulC
MKNFTLSSLSNYLKAFRYTGRLRPERDWLMVLLVTFVLLLVSISWNVWFFINLVHGENVTPVAQVPHTVSSAAAVTNVQNIFKARATEQNNYQQTYTFVDPSLPGS